ncbi:MAG TPA: PspA/IM30 family protein [Gaiellales bacterium]|nr:PspA/IM30 family protein [Gaiellales bacterium]
MSKPNPIVRAWKYLTAWAGAKVDEKADPRVQIEQAIQEAQRQHQALTQQAAAVIGNQRQLEMQLDRQLNSVEDLQAQARQALVLADQAHAAGDEVKAARFEQTAQALANQLVSAESATEDLKRLHDQALQAATQAREAVQTNAQILQQKLAERSKLLSQLEQAKMQETVSASLQQMSDLAAPSNVPTLDEVRDKIERRYAVAIGQAEVARDSTASHVLEVQRATRDMQGAARLEEIRAALTADSKAALSGAGGSAVAGAAENAAIESAPAPEAPVVDTTKPGAASPPAKKAPAKKAAAKKAAAKKPAANKAAPASQAPAPQDPASQDPAPQDPAQDAPAGETPAAEAPARQEPAAQPLPPELRADGTNPDQG